MSATLFVTISIALNLILGISVLFRNYRNQILIPLICSGILLPFSSYWGIEFVSRSENFKPENVFYFFLLNIICAISLTFLTNNFMQKSSSSVFTLGKVEIKLGSINLLLISLTGLILLFTIFFKEIRFAISSYIYQNRSILFSIANFLLIGFYIYSSYLLEDTFRYAKEYQRRIGRLFFIPMAIILIYHIFFFTTVILYQKIFLVIIQSGLVITGISYPVLLLGFFRYRLGFERVTVPRNTVYSSFSLLITGAIFLGIGLTLYLFRILHINFDYFEWAIIVFTFSFLLILIAGSGQMRKRIMLFVNNKFYSTKYDYRDQFFRLHQAYMHGDSLNESIINLVENMKYAVAAHDAFVFLREPHSYSFVLKKNPEFTSFDPVILHSNDPVITAFENSFEPLDLIHDSQNQRVKTVLESINTLRHISPSIIFPIPYNNTLTGLLMLSTNNKLLDIEDQAIIKVFTETIGYTYYKDHLFQTTIENSQFHSFNQVVSFVMHDIKNQIATLSLLAKNADQYIENADFQKSLIRSIHSCSQNLTSLVEKLSSNRKGLTLSTRMQPILPILEKVTTNEYINSNNEIKIEWIAKEPCIAIVDEFALEQVFMNLMKNGIEAMAHKGILRIYCSQSNNEHPEQLNRFNLPRSTLLKKKVVIIIEDTGYGMDNDFIKSRLFKPFETTKDKGIGIGLYQCKTYIEKMGGMLLCNSQQNKGTSFCILL